MADPDTSEDRLLSLAENYYLDLRGSFDDSVEKVQTNTTCNSFKFSTVTVKLWQYLLIVDV